MYDLLPYWVKVFRISDEKQIEGIPFQALCRVTFTNISDEWETYYLTTLIIAYKDGFIHCNYELITFEELLEKISSGVIRIQLPENSSIVCYNLGQIKAQNFTPYKTNEDFIKEIEDAIKVLNGRIPRWEICYNAFKKYLLHDSKENLEELIHAFNDLPSHKKRIMDYTDEKDPLIKLMSGKISSFTIEKRQYMLNDYYDGEWSEDEFKVSDSKE